MSNSPDGSFIAAEAARSFLDDQMREYLAPANPVSDERKIHCFLEFLEARLASVRATEPFDLPTNLDKNVHEGCMFFLNKYQEYNRSVGNG